MFRVSKCACAFAFGLLITLLSFSYASAHCFVGARFFPATLATDDPCVADEMSLPTVGWSKTGDIPAGERSGYIGRHLETDHRGFRSFHRRYLVADPPTRQSGARRLRQSRYHLPISTHEGRFARIG